MEKHIHRRRPFLDVCKLIDNYVAVGLIIYGPCCSLLLPLNIMQTMSKQSWYRKLSFWEPKVSGKDQRRPFPEYARVSLSLPLLTILSWTSAWSSKNDLEKFPQNSHTTHSISTFYLVPPGRPKMFNVMSRTCHSNNRSQTQPPRSVRFPSIKGTQKPLNSRDSMSASEKVHPKV